MRSNLRSCNNGMAPFSPVATSTSHPCCVRSDTNDMVVGRCCWTRSIFGLYCVWPRFPSLRIKFLICMSLSGILPVYTNTQVAGDSFKIFLYIFIPPVRWSDSFAKNQPEVSLRIRQMQLLIQYMHCIIILYFVRTCQIVARMNSGIASRHRIFPAQEGR